MKNQQKKLNNKGFSLVELIIVIAIMAILAGAMAPQLMKYLDKARVSTDTANMDSLKTATETALADETAYNAVPAAGLTVTTTNGTSGGDATAVYNPTTVTGFSDELNKIVSKWPNAKAKDKTGFLIKIDAEKKVTVTYK